MLSTIQEMFLTQDHYSRQRVIQEVQTRCRAEHLQPPGESTIYRQMANLSIQDVVRAKAGKRAWKTRFKQLVGEAPKGAFPLDLVEVDHFIADLIVLSEDRHTTLGRPWVTLMVDTYSRCVLAVIIGMSKPGVAEVLRAISMAVLPKDKLLADLGLELPWPCYGLPSTLLADNAWEFRSEQVIRCIAPYHIDLMWRMVAQPEKGPHIERLVNTIETEIAQLPGATFSRPDKRGTYDSQARAALTLSEFQSFLFRFILGTYHRRPHHGLDGIPPLVRWTEGLEGNEHAPGIGEPRQPEDPARFVLDMLPIERRTLSRHGIRLHNIYYQSEALQTLVGYRDPKHPNRAFRFTLRVDEADLSRIFLMDPRSNTYHVVPYRDISLRPMTLDEVQERNRRIRARFTCSATEDLLLRERQEMTAIVDAAQQRTRLARRKKQKLKRALDCGPCASHAPGSPLEQAEPEAALLPDASESPALSVTAWDATPRFTEVD